MPQQATEVAPATPSELLVAWRQAERRRAVAASPDEAAALSVQMRGLMDEYEWAVRGRAGRRPEDRVRAG
jgi:hypothetical protein